MYQPPLIFNPWVLFVSLGFFTLAVLVLAWRAFLWEVVERVLIASQNRGNVAVARRGAHAVSVIVAVGLALIGFVGLVDRWNRLEPNGFSQAIEQAGSSVSLVVVGGVIYALGIVLAGFSERISRSIESRSSNPTRFALASPVTVALLVAIGGALLLTFAVGG